MNVKNETLTSVLCERILCKVNKAKTKRK